MADLIPSRVEFIGRITGASLPGETMPNLNDTHRRDAILGTDLGTMWACGGGRMMMAFGDTYGDGWCGSGAGPETADWRSNTLAVLEPFDPATGPAEMRFVQDRLGHAAEVIESRKDGVEHTVIPTSGVTIDGRHCLHFMSVHHFGKAGLWLTNYGGLAYSDDGVRWTKSETVQWTNTPSGDASFQMGAMAAADGYVYLYGTPNGRGGRVTLARAAQAELLTMDKYEYWNGAEWIAGKPAACAPVLEGPVGEMSVAYNSYFGRWLMTHIEGVGSDIILRDAPAPTGPWSKGRVLVSGREVRGAYGGFIDPLHCDGPELYFALSLWYKYNVFWMRANLSL